MKCSMMSKIWILLALTVGILLSAQVQVRAETSPEMPDGTGDFLVLYSDRISEDAEKMVETIVTMSSAMGKIADYCAASQCTQILDQYEYIVCYDLSDEDEVFYSSMETYKGKVMILGGAFTQEYLNMRGYEYTNRKEKSPLKGTLSYSLSDGIEYKEIIKLDKLLIFQDSGYTSGEIQIDEEIVPFCIQAAGARFIPVTDFEGKVSTAALFQELSLWLWPYKDSPPDYAQYLVLDEVYPFMDCNELKKRVDKMIESDVPFSISVMPVLQNGNYPSMKEFCQVLAYAQKNGGAIILHAPIIHKTVEDVEEIYEKITDMTMVYVNQGVYPMGIEVPISWLYTDIYLELLERYRTVFVYDDGKETGFSAETGTSIFGRQGHQVVMPAISLGSSGESSLKCYSSAVYIDSVTSGAELTDILANSRSSSTPFMNLWDLEHSVWINDFWISYTGGLLYLNGEYTEMKFEPEEYEEGYDYQRDMIQRITINLQNQNRVLMVIVVIVIIIFASFIIYARIRNRKQFLYKNKKEE